MPTTPRARETAPWQRAAQLMAQFERDTGATGDGPGRRYLWTDAFAVANWIGLSRASGDESHRMRALRLIERVHEELGRHRDDDSRTGWLSGLPDDLARRHPTRAGLRIGKPLPERRGSEPFDERLEWERDGQYFHYLTKWMQALDLATRATGDPCYFRWAAELARTARRAFTRPARDGAAHAHLFWKMSIDLSRPAVPSFGAHDPLDGYVTALQLERTARHFTDPGLATELLADARAFREMIEAPVGADADPLSIGGLLTDAHRLDQLRHLGGPVDDDLVGAALRSALSGLQALARWGLSGPPSSRLAFRELGLGIGLAAAQRMRRAASENAPASAAAAYERPSLEAIGAFAHVGREIVAHWSDEAVRRGSVWQAHRDINGVMLATALEPCGWLSLHEPLPGRR